MTNKHHEDEAPSTNNYRVSQTFFVFFSDFLKINFHFNIVHITERDAGDSHLMMLRDPDVGTSRQNFLEKNGFLCFRILSTDYLFNSHYSVLCITVNFMPFPSF